MPEENNEAEEALKKALEDPNFGLKLGMALRKADEEFWFKRRLMTPVGVTRRDLEEARDKIK